MIRRTTIACLALVAVLAVTGCSDDSDSNDDSGSSDDGPETTAPAEETTAAAESDAAPLQGTWRTPPITIADMADTLREAGLGQFVSRFEQNAPISDAPTELILELGKEWDLYGEPQGGAREEIDYDADFVVEGTEVVKYHADGADTYEWTISDDVLRLTWLKTTLPDYKGIPEEVFQRALYMTADFQREGG